MKKSFIGTWLLTICWGCLTFSCNTEDSIDSTSLNSNHCAITDITLGSLIRTIQSQTSSGKDTTYNTTLSGSLYALYIDQYKGEIYNPDSLPIGTHVDKVIFSNISSDGILSYRTANGTDTLFSRTDTLDFTHPRTFICFSYSGKAKKEYTVSINVHQVNSELFVWQQQANAHDIWTDITLQKAFYKDAQLNVFALKAGQPVCISTPTSSPQNWTVTYLPFSSFNPSNIQLLHNIFYMVADNKVMRSDDGIHWSDSGSSLVPDALTAHSSSHLYAIKDGAMYVSADGAVWESDAVENASHLLPASHFTSVWMPMSFNSNFEYVIMGGLLQDGTTPTEWKKVIDNKDSNTEPWNYFNAGNDITFPYPSLPGTQIIAYDNRIYSLGIQGDTLSLFSISNDGGRTWIPQSNTYLHPTAIPASNFSWTIDEDKYMWIFCGGSGDIWRGRINRLGFKNNQTSFTQ